MYNKFRRNLTGYTAWATVKNVIQRTQDGAATWRFRSGCWTCRYGVTYRWVIRGEIVRCTQLFYSQRYQFEMSEPQLSELLSAIVLSPNSIIPDFKER